MQATECYQGGQWPLFNQHQIPHLFQLAQATSVDTIICDLEYTFYSEQLDIQFITSVTLPTVHETSDLLLTVEAKHLQCVALHL